MTTEQQTKLDGFRAAAKIAFNQAAGTYRRAAGTSYRGYKDPNGRCFVIGDSADDVQNAAITIDGYPAREVFDGFTIMSK